MTTTKIAWTPIREEFGARIEIDLNTELTDSVLEELSRIFDERHMLIFPNQDIDLETQRRVVAAVGKPFDTEVQFVSSHHDPHGKPQPTPTDPDPRTVQFHSDLVFHETLPVHGISLYALDVSGNTEPGFQGTKFISARSGYVHLTDSEKAELEGRTLLSLHSLTLSTEDQIALRNHPFKDIEDQTTWWAEHPLLYPLPRTGEKTLMFIPWFAHSISGMSPEESQKWFARFEELLYADENQTYSHRWEQGDFVFWNNLALQHAKETTEPFDGPLPTRVLRRQAYGPVEPNLY
ncbi:TauD/TfdA family dioxygenase [Nocardia sp. 348MFTsu5.1]|uniref:TauD/TfdA dioxygenase family protein n=1 Tax=Nocardia sp. 348MFTsu5.1 TaxID=1172185 RepID=UPI000378B395|nr:TauD/TfdA family dioxygenase [Nocardia sp. 348MFTsu5.1]